MRLWEVRKVNGEAVILPSKPFFCPVCGGDLILHDFSCRYQASFDFYHCDVHMKCVQCGFFLTFGVPVTREEYETLTRSKYHARILKWELKEIYKDKDSIIEERLRRWGYW